MTLSAAQGSATSMPLRILGRSGFRVSEFSLGAMTFGTDWGFGSNEQVSAEVYSVFREAGARVALAWVMTRGLMPSLGARTSAQLRDNLGAAKVQLDQSHLDRLDKASRIRLGYPHDFLNERRDVLGRSTQRT